MRKPFNRPDVILVTILFAGACQPAENNPSLRSGAASGSGCSASSDRKGHSSTRRGNLPDIEKVK